jgi:hypothetical protein
LDLHPQCAVKHVAREIQRRLRGIRGHAVAAVAAVAAARREGRGKGGCEERALLMLANRPMKGALVMHDLLMQEKRPTNACIAAH